MKGFSVLLKKELKEQWRTFKLPVLAAISLLVGIASPLAAKYTPLILERYAGDIQVTLPPPTAKDALDQFAGNFGLVAIVAVILITMGAIAREKESGTADLVLTKPVTRTAFLASKFFAITTTLALSVILAGAGTYLYTAVLFETLPVAAFLAFCGLQLLMYLVYLTTTLLASVLVRSALPAAAIGLGSYIGISAVGAIPVIGDWMPAELTTVGTNIVLGNGNSLTGFLGPFLFSVVSVTAALVVADIHFRRQRW